MPKALCTNHHHHDENLLKEASHTPNPHNNSNHVLKKLFYVFLLAALIMSVEIAGGILAGSISILSDAAHMLSDVLGFVISIISVWISTLPANSQYSFGYHRASVIGALASALLIWGLTGSLMYYSAIRIANIEQVEVEGNIMLCVACFGLICNLCMVKILHGDSGCHSHFHSNCQSHSHNKTHKHHEHNQKSHKSHKNPTKSHKKHNHNHGEEHECLRVEWDDEECAVFNAEIDDIESYCEEKHSSTVRKEKSSHARLLSYYKNKVKSFFKIMDSDNLNVRVTLVHILGDILQSIGVIIASIMIWISPEKFKIVDPMMTFVFAGIALFTTIRVVKDCVLVLMEGAPREINIKALEQKLRKMDNIKEVKNLHVWSVSSNQIQMTAHIFTDGDSEEILSQAKQLCLKYGINNSTIQIERIRDFL